MKQSSKNKGAIYGKLIDGNLTGPPELVAALAALPMVRAHGVLVAPVEGSDMVRMLKPRAAFRNPRRRLEGVVAGQVIFGGKQCGARIMDLAGGGSVILLGRGVPADPPLAMPSRLFSREDWVRFYREHQLGPGMEDRAILERLGWAGAGAGARSAAAGLKELMLAAAAVTVPVRQRHARAARDLLAGLTLAWPEGGAPWADYGIE